MTNQDQLNGWKEIATYLGRSTRAAQRWERDLAMPVRRMRTAKGGEIVYALRSEIDSWKLTGGAQRDEKPVDDAEPAAALPAEPTSVSRPWPLLAMGAAFGLVAIGVILVRMERAPLAAPADGAGVWTLRSDAPGGLDPGPLPTAGRDAARTNWYAATIGPEHAPAARRIYSAPVLGDHTPLAVLSSGNVLIGSCGMVTALDSAGRVVWQHELTRRGYREEPGGFAVGANGRIYFATAECPDSLDAVRLGTYAFLATGQLYWHQQHGSVHQAPAVDVTGGVFVLDEMGTLRAYTSDGGFRWVTDLAGFGHGLITFTSDGSLVVGNDGGMYNGSSLWMLDSKTGRIKWAALDGPLLTPVISDTLIIVPDQRGSVMALDQTRRKMWTADVGAPMKLMPLALGRTQVYARTTAGIVALDGVGARRWSFAAPVEVDRAESVHVDRNEDLYGFDRSGVFSLNSGGQQRWRVPLDNVRQIALSGDRQLYALCRDGLYFLSDAAGQ